MNFNFVIKVFFSEEVLKNTAELEIAPSERCPNFGRLENNVAMGVLYIAHKEFSYPDSFSLI